MNVAVIPARGGSKRIPRKNIKEFCGKPMIAWPIEVAKESGLFEHIIISTDDEEIAEILSKKNEFLLELNLELIKFFMKILKINTKIICSSELNVDSFGTEKILKIVQAIKGDKYLTGEGKGSQRYIVGKDDLFKNEGIKMLHQNFQFPYYPQLYDEFIPNLSICDMLFNIGAEKIITEINEQKIKF